ncbi:MAG: SRPBCC family protein [Mucilaginibacter sp.]|nr:SRPBCC family protein [Mucilaginibacter sp.]
MNRDTAGFIVPQIFGAAIVALTKLLLNPHGSSSGTLIFSEFVIVPLLMGIISARYWRNLDMRAGRSGLRALLNTAIACIISAAFLGEGVICLLIVSPLLFIFIWMGQIIGGAMFKKNNNTLNTSIVVLLLAVFVSDSLSEHHYENLVADTIVIKAPPAKVWQYVVAYERIEEKPKFWLFKIGMPSPVQSTADGYYVGAKRKCIFSNGYVFDEVISKYDENHDLIFDITHQPRDPEIMGHIDILRGQFLLKDNGDGTTTLTGNSWYKLYVFPTWYYDMWASSIVRNVHVRVMDRVKQLSEAK